MRKSSFLRIMISMLLVFGLVAQFSFAEPAFLEEMPEEAVTTVAEENTEASAEDSAEANPEAPVNDEVVDSTSAEVEVPVNNEEQDSASAEVETSAEDSATGDAETSAEATAGDEAEANTEESPGKPAESATEETVAETQDDSDLPIWVDLPQPRTPLTLYVSNVDKTPTTVQVRFQQVLEGVDPALLPMVQAVKYDQNGTERKSIVPGVETLTFEVTGNGTIEVRGAYVGQEYEVIVDGVEGKKSTIRYLCKAGRVKLSQMGDGESNTIACAVRNDDGSEDDLVTDPSMINRAEIYMKSTVEKEGEIPFEFRFDFAGGAVASGCSSSSSGSYSQSVRVDLLPVDQENTKATFFVDMDFLQTSDEEDEIKTISYLGKGVTYSKEGQRDVFTKTDRLSVPENLQPGENVYIVTTPPGTTPPGSPGYRIVVTADEEGNYVSHRIYKDTFTGYGEYDEPLFDEEEVEVVQIDTVTEDSGRENLEVMNITQWEEDIPFTYELTVPLLEGEEEQTYKLHKYEYISGSRVQTEDIDYKPGEVISFTMKKSDSIILSNLPHGGSIHLVQKDPEGMAIRRTNAVYNAYPARPLTVNRQEGEAILDYAYSTPVVFQAVDAWTEDQEYTLHPKVPEPCHPQVPEPAYITIANTREPGMEIKIQKQGTVQPLPEDASLAGAVFHAFGTNGEKYYATTDENGVATFYDLSPTEAWGFEEIKAPKGYQISKNVPIYRPETAEEYKYDQALTFVRYNRVPYLVADEDIISDNPVTIKFPEEPRWTEVEVRKFFLPDESKYDGPHFEALAFVLPEDTVSYRDSIWPRSFFEDVPGVEFEMTLDSDPSNPYFTYTAVTDDSGKATFQRKQPLAQGETEDVLRRVYPGTYTIREVSTPEGMRPMKEQKITISPKDVNGAYNPISNKNVVRVVNVSAKGNLSISKKVSGKDASLTKEFSFQVAFNDKDGNPLEETFAYTGSKEGTIKSGDSITLKHGESITIEDLPEGTQYRVTETPAEGYQTTVNGQSGNEATGTIEDRVTAQAAFVNTVPEELKEEPPIEKPEKPTPPADPTDDGEGDVHGGDGSDGTTVGDEAGTDGQIIEDEESGKASKTPKNDKVQRAGKVKDKNPATGDRAPVTGILLLGMSGLVLLGYLAGRRKKTCKE